MPHCLIRSVKHSGKQANATALFLWRERFELRGEKTFHNIEYLRCMYYCFKFHPFLLWPSLIGTASIRVHTPHNHCTQTYWNTRVILHQSLDYAGDFKIWFNIQDGCRTCCTSSRKYKRKR